MIHATADLKPLVEGTISRTLAADRYLDLPSPEDRGENTTWRTQSCERIKRGTTQSNIKLAAWHGPTGFLATLQKAPGHTRLLRSRQISRLLVNLGGSALENGGMCLDRLSGLPFIPGSAVKGIARREALLTARVADSLEDRAAWIANIAENFGWGPDDWSDRGDFAQSSGDDWPTVRAQTRTLIAEAFGIEPKALPAAYRGRVYFLPAFPETSPAVVPDIVTCHHPDYYTSIVTDVVALDIEEPRPVVFPAVEKGAAWIFPIHIPAGTGGAEVRLEECAKFLEAGLRQGIGAKTAAGYGRFESVKPMPDNPSAMPDDIVELTFVTPCMCAGARQQVAEIRTSSLRGELRWWFRALGGTKAQENEVFGSVAGKAKSSALLLDIIAENTVRTPWITATGARGKVYLQEINTEASYLWHFAAVSGCEGGKENRLWRSGRKGGVPNQEATFSPGTRFTLRRSWRRPIVNQDAKQLFNLAWSAFLHFGAIGLRANRAMGCWMPQKSNHNAVITQLRQKGFHVVISDQNLSDWKTAVNYLGAWMKNRIRKDHPLGKNEQSQNPTPLGRANPKRQASAVRFRVLKLGENKFVPLAFEAPHARTLDPVARSTPALRDPSILQGAAPRPPEKKKGGW